MELMQHIKPLLDESLALEEAQSYAQALQHIQNARRAHPANRMLAIRHGQLLEATKQYPAAVGLYRQLFDARPETQEAELVLGMARALLRTARYEQSHKLFTRLSAQLPRHPDVLTGLAEIQRHRGQLDEALKLVQTALEVSSDFKPATHELAEIKLTLKDDEAALVALERNTLREDLYGDSLDLWLNTLKRLGRDRYTQARLEEMVERFPNKVEFVFGLGVQAHRAGEVTIARRALEKASALHPDNPRILYEWGVLERTSGDIARSQALIGRSLELMPEQAAALRTYGTEHKYAYGDEVFTRLNYAAARLADLQALEQVHMHYALGKAFEDVNELDTAFRHYETAGVKKRRLETYDERGNARMFNLMPKLVNAQSLKASVQRGCEDETPVFVLGMPRSGTSLIEQILSSHPDIFGAGELKLMSSVLDHIEVAGKRIQLNDRDPMFKPEDDASWATRGQCYVERLKKLADKPCARIVDKMPGNFTMLGLIHAVLPNARIIHSRRHPVETCLSNYRIHFAEGQFWSYNLRELGRYYKRYWHLMKHWREQFPEAMLEVRYEDNVADVEGQARKIIHYLGLDWNDNCLNFHNTDRPVKTASAAQVRKPIYKTSTNRWRKYEKYLGPLLEELGDIVPEYEAEIAHLIEK